MQHAEKEEKEAEEEEEVEEEVQERSKVGAGGLSAPERGSHQRKHWFVESCARHGEEEEEEEEEERRIKKEIEGGA
ncbi:hypothetical protein CRUP_005641 [Coryphaenoides rupestris]|nr:hypothetical protein CRUP_005641 [Coryphaenoides rupestris]